MKSLFLSSLLAVTALGLSSCCCMFGGLGKAEHKTVEKRVCGYDTVTKEVQVSSKDAKGGMLTETVTTKGPRYKNVKVKDNARCVRSYCPGRGTCGNTTETTINMATDQGGVGSPHIGLVPTMRVLAP